MTENSADDDGSVEQQELLEPDEVILPEVVGEGGIKRAERAFGPVIAGLIIDIVDLATFGPIGIFSGMIIGGLAAYWVCSIYGMPMKQRLLWALAAGTYCTIPFTEIFPLATLIGAYARYSGWQAK